MNRTDEPWPVPEPNAQSVFQLAFAGTARLPIGRMRRLLPIVLASFYPSVKTSDTGELLEESVLEHLAVKRVLATMMETAPDGDVFAELEELGGLLEAHVIEEEQTLFPKVSQEVDDAELRQLGARMSEMVQQLRRERAPRMHVTEETEEPAPI